MGQSLRRLDGSSGRRSIFEPCLSSSEQAMVKALSAMLRRAPGLARKPDALLTVARHGIATGEPDTALAARRARRVVLIALCRAAAARRDAEAA
jgi:hypothetical protein